MRIIRQAELQARSPHYIAAALRDRAKLSEQELQNDYVDSDIEMALLYRDEPAISLALARFGRFEQTMQLLFRASKNNEAYRCAILSNAFAGSGSIYYDFPCNLFGGREQAIKWLSTASSLELDALFANPNIDDRFLFDLLSRHEPFDSIEQFRLAEIVGRLSHNPRMAKPYIETYLDYESGHHISRYNSVFCAAWTLAAIVEPTVFWAISLSSLFQHLHTNAESSFDPVNAAQRWFPDASNQEVVASEAKQISSAWRDPYFLVRRGLARLCLKSYKSKLDDLLNSSDEAFRCAAYSEGELAPEQIYKGFERDGFLAFDVLAENPSNWKALECRSALWNISNGTDGHSSARYVFNQHMHRFSSEHPEWFKVESESLPVISEDRIPASKQDISSLTVIIGEVKTYSDLLYGMISKNSLGSELKQVREAVEELSKQVARVEESFEIRFLRIMEEVQSEYSISLWILGIALLIVLLFLFWR